MTDKGVVSYFEEILRDLIGRGNVRQAITAVKSYDQTVEGVGAAADPGSDIEEPSPDTPFYPASIDKLLNATIVMMLTSSRSTSQSTPSCGAT